MPQIKIVSHWEGSEHQGFVRNATRIRAIWLRHALEDSMLITFISAKALGSIG